MSLNYVTDSCHVLVSRISVLVCSPQYREHRCHC